MLEELKEQVKVLRGGISRPRNKPILRDLVAIHGRLSRHVGLTEALLERRPGFRTPASRERKSALVAGGIDDAC